jgi:hypothetical protein
MVLSYLFILIGNVIFSGLNIGSLNAFSQQYYSSDPMVIPSTIGTTIGSPVKNGPNNATPLINNINNYPGVCRPIYDNKSLPSITSTETLTHTGTVTLGPQTYTNTLKIGPDHFRFIYSYWTDKAANRGLGVSFGFFGTNIPTPIETDRDGGPNTLSVVLHYEGVNDLEGITAALRLPPGFEPFLPPAYNINRNDIAFSSYQGNITHGHTIILNFPVIITGDVEVLQPYPAMLALHFLKPHDRHLTYTANVSDEEELINALTVNQKIPSPPAAPGSQLTKNCNNTNTFTNGVKETYNIDKPDDYVHQITGITLKVTGIENPNVNVNVDPTLDEKDLTKMATVNNGGKATKLIVNVSNTGDAPMYNVKAEFSYPSMNAKPLSVNPGSEKQPYIPPVLLDPRIDKNTTLSPSLLNSINSLNSRILSANENPLLPNPVLNPNEPNPIVNPFTTPTVATTATAPNPPIPALIAPNAHISTGSRLSPFFGTAPLSPFFGTAPLNPFLATAPLNPFLATAPLSPLILGSTVFNPVTPGVTLSSATPPADTSGNKINTLTLSIIGPSIFDIGYLKPHSSKIITLIVVGFNNLGDFANAINTSVKYTDANGFPETYDPLLGISTPKT